VRGSGGFSNKGVGYQKRRRGRPKYPLEKEVGGRDSSRKEFHFLSLFHILIGGASGHLTEGQGGKKKGSCHELKRGKGKEKGRSNLGGEFLRFY